MLQYLHHQHTHYHLPLAPQGRLSDSNKNLVAHVLTTLGDLARAMGPPFAQQMRPLVLPALANLNDSKKHVREAVATMLDTWVAVVPADRFLQQLADTFMSAKCSPDGKRVAVAWLLQQVCRECVGLCRECGYDVLNCMVEEMPIWPSHRNLHVETLKKECNNNTASFIKQ